MLGDGRTRACESARRNRRVNKKILFPHPFCFELEFAERIDDIGGG